MMRVLITGAAGMIGRKLAQRLRSDGSLDDQPIDAVDLVDIVPTPQAVPFEESIVADLAEAGTAEELVAHEPDVVFHLAGVVSGEAEADFDKGTRVNLDGTRALFDALRRYPRCPRVVFTSSIAVFGAPLPDVIGDDFHLTPLTSYGTQKLIGEALLADYSRRGFFDGVGIRLPTISVRPGSPNAAASSFFSAIIREPLAGEEAYLPVRREVRHPHASPLSAVGFLVHAAEIDTDLLSDRRNLTMPSVSVTVGEQIQALERAAGPATVALIREEPDQTIASIVAGWPRRFDTTRADALGFRCESTFDEIIQIYIEDEKIQIGTRAHRNH
jgi:nucleoside-diphosphate-sugar epimerase